jgi:hypothetical protein
MAGQGPAASAAFQAAAARTMSLQQKRYLLRRSASLAG